MFLLLFSALPFLLTTLPYFAFVYISGASDEHAFGGPQVSDKYSLPDSCPLYGGWAERTLVLKSPALLPGSVNSICMISGTAPNLSVPVSTSVNVTTLHCTLVNAWEAFTILPGR